MSFSSDLSPEMGSPEHNTAQMEERLRKITASFPYPATPDIAAGARRRLAGRAGSRQRGRLRRLVVAVAIVLILLSAAMLVSPVRARVLDWIRIGSVRIFFFLPTPTMPPPIPTTTPLPAGTPSPVSTPTPEPTPTFLQSVLDIQGETSLEAAREAAGFTILLPTYPPDLGEPDFVYLQEFNRKAVILVWMDKERPGQVRMSLTESSSESYLFEKYSPKSVEEIQVNGHAGVWIDGEYVLVMRNGDVTLTRMINQGHTLIWSDGKMTFRMETDETLEEAIKIGESLR